MRPVVLALASFAMLAVFATPARATVRPPSDTLRVELAWVQRTVAPWTARIRLVRYATATVAPGSGVRTSLALRTTDPSVILGADSAVVVLPGTAVRVPGIPQLAADAAVAEAFRVRPGAPAKGTWYGAMGSAPAMPVLPNEPVDVCWFVRVPGGTPDDGLITAVRGCTFASATASAGVPGADAAYKAAGPVRGPGTARGGSDDPFRTAP